MPVWWGHSSTNYVSAKTGKAGGRHTPVLRHNGCIGGLMGYRYVSGVLEFGNTSHASGDGSLKVAPIVIGSPSTDDSFIAPSHANGFN